MVKINLSTDDNSAKSTFADWQNIRLCSSGKKDGFKWYIGEYELPFVSGKMIHPSSFTPMTSSIVRVAYVDVTGTKLDGITNTGTIDELGIELYCGCTFAGSSESAELLRRIEELDGDHWFIGEDYAHDLFGKPEKSITIEQIANHLEQETIPSIIKALVTLDVKDLIF